MAGGRNPPGCPLLRTLPRAGWRWATCTWLLATCELSCPLWGGVPQGLPARAPAPLCNPKAPGKQGLRWGQDRGRHAELSSLSQLQGLIMHTQARL